MTDPFAEVVALLQPSLSFSKATSGSGAWRVVASGDGLSLFCVILEGSARLLIQGQDPLELSEGAFVLVPAAHTFSMESTFPTTAAPGQDPYRISRLAGEIRHGDPAAAVNMRALVGRIAFGSPNAALLVALLPRLIHVQAEKRLGIVVQLIRNEAQDDRPARDMVLERLLQVLLIEALRSTPEIDGSPGLLRGMADARLAIAIRHMHENPDRDWTMEQLAGMAALSRSAFFDRFRQRVGMSPMEYLLSWRMALAKHLLRQGQVGIKEIAERVGYGSASAFSVAFNRFEGTPPMRYAKTVKAEGQL